MFKSKCKENNNKDLLWETDGYPPPNLQVEFRKLPVFIYKCPKKKRGVHSSLIYRRILIIYTPN
jgi:hypothetical protein